MVGTGRAHPHVGVGTVPVQCDLRRIHMADAMAQTETGPRANFGQRFAAAFIDGAMLAVVGYVLGQISNGLAGAGILIGLAYYVYLEGSPSGQTVGKKVMNIRVIDADNGGPIGYGRAVLRYFARYLS